MNYKENKMKSKDLVEVRRMELDESKPWVVDIVHEGSGRTGYVQPDGTAGKAYKYNAESSALRAARLYCEKHAEKTVEITTSAEDKKPVCGGCKNYDPQADANCCIVDLWTVGRTALVNECSDFEPYTPVEEKKDTNPKDIIGMKKAPMSTLSCPVLFEMGLGMLEGARKYGRHNYRAMGVSATVYYDAAMGHLMDWFEGEDIDPDSGMSHVTKAMTALVVLRDSMLMENWIDDRPLRNPNKLFKKSFNPKAEAIIEKIPDAVVPYLETNKDLKRGG